MVQLANEVQKSGGELTVAHYQREGWFEVWERKLGEAQGVIVVFTDKYRDRFTDALQKEARAILKRCDEDKQFKLFIWDPEKDGAPTIRANIMDDASHMGDIYTWKRYVEKRTSGADMAQQQQPTTHVMRQSSLNKDMQTNPLAEHI